MRFWKLINNRLDIGFKHLSKLIQCFVITELYARFNNFNLIDFILKFLIYDYFFQPFKLGEL